MNLRACLSRYILLPLASIYSGRMHFKALHYKRFLEKTEYWHRNRIEDLRNKQFRLLVFHCYKNVPYYRQYMDENNLTLDDFSTIKDITKFPILEKEILNKNIQSLTATNYSRKNIRYESTGGTTGTPIHFGSDVKNYFRVHANAWRMWQYAGYIYGMKTILFWGNRIELDRISNLREKLKAIIENTKMLNFYDFSENHIIQFANYIKKVKPDVIRGFSGAIYLFVEYCKKYKIQFSASPKAIILTSENIFSTHKNKIANFFKCEVYEEYGAREFGNMAHECNVHQGLHLAEELFIFEVASSNSNKCSFEGKGELLVTPLYNYAMPLIRYRIEDEVTISSEFCPCGRNLRLLENIDGRIADYVITKSCKFVHQGIFNNLFYSSKGILMYQVQQYKKGEVIIYIVKDKDFSKQTMEILASNFRKMYKDDLTVTFKYVKKISVSSSGKRRSVISHIADQYIKI